MADDWDTGIPVAQQAPAEDDSWDTGVPVGAKTTPPFKPGFSSQWGISRSGTVQDQHLDNTSIGRVLDAFGEGAKSGWGASPLGLSPATSKAMGDIGLTEDLDAKHNNILRIFNGAIIRPAAAGLDAILRSVPAAIEGTAGAISQASVELGLQDENKAARMNRELVSIGNVAAILSADPQFFGVGPMGKAPDTVLLREGGEVKNVLAPDAVAGESIPKPMAVEGAVQSAPIVSPWEQSLVDAGIRKPTPQLAATPKQDFIASEPITSPTQTFQKSDNPNLGKAGNINLARIQAPNDVKQAIEEAAQANPGFNPLNTRGVMTFSETEALAQAIGVEPSWLLKRGIGEAFNAEHAVAARNTLVQSATELRQMALKARGGTDLDVLAFQESLAKHAMIQEQVAGMTAEAGRALSSFRIMAKAQGEAKDISAILKEAGGRENLDELARRIGDLETPQQIGKFILDARKATTMDKIQELWVNALLSGPTTHVANIIGNGVTTLWRTAETQTAGAIGLLRGAPEDRVYFGEGASKLFGLFQGAPEGLRAAWRGFVTEKPAAGASKLEQQAHKAVSGTKGQIVRIPGRALLAADEFFKTVTTRASLNAQAYRKAAKAGLKGDAFKTRVADLVQNPTSTMLERAGKEADYDTFTKALGTSGQAFQRILNEHPVAKFIIPFFRTPVNILKFAGERTPLSIASREVRDILAGKQGAAARDEQIAKIALGSTVAVTTFVLASRGQITGGGPRDPAERALLRLTGWQPYSLKIGDMYYSYARFEPFATIMGVSADAYEIGSKTNEQDAGDIGALIMASASNNVLSKTWMQGISNVIEAIQDPERYGAGFVNQMAGTLVPTGLAQAARVEDPYLRDARNIVDTIKSRIPGLSTEVAVKRDTWGEPIERGGAAGPDMVSPIYQSKVNNDPVNQELLNLGIYPSKLDRQIDGVDLTAKQYDDYQRIAGRLAHYTLDQMVKIPGWADLPPYARTEVMTKAISRARDKARTYMRMAYPDILVTATQRRIDQIQGSSTAP